MEEKVIELQRVRFKRYHGGMGVDVGECLDVPKTWAEKAIASRIVEAVGEETAKDFNHGLHG